MRRYFILILLLIVPTWCNAGMISMLAEKIADTCTIEYNPSLSEDTNLSVNYDHPYTGGYYTPSGDQDVCQISIYITLISGTLSSSHDYYVRIYTITSTQLDTEVITSAKVDGDGQSVDTYWDFVFASNSLSNDVEYGISLFLDSDGNPDDVPELDSSNFPRIAVDDENNGDAIWKGAMKWDSVGARASTDYEDDLLIKVYTR